MSHIIDRPPTGPAPAGEPRSEANTPFTGPGGPGDGSVDPIHLKGQETSSFRGRNGLRLALLLAGIAALGFFGGWPVLAIVGAMIVSIALHEFGHFITAKRTGMKATEFFLGFGPRIWSFRRGETEYGLKALPLGAYVRIVGMHSLEEVAPEDEPRSYRAQSYPKRLLVVLAGPFMNFLIGFVLLLVVFMGFGQQQPDRWTVGRVLDGSSAAEMGLQPGDRVISFDGQPVGDFESLSSVIQPTAGQPVDVVVLRNGEQITLNGTVGWRLDEAAAAAVPPLVFGDQVLSVNNQPVSDYDQFRAALQDVAPGTATVEFERRDYTYDATVTVPADLPPVGYSGFLGVGAEVPRVRETPIGAVGESASTFGGLLGSSVEGLGHFFSPSGLSKYASLVFSTPPTGQDSSTQPSTTEVRPVEENAPTVVAQPADNSADQNRVLSIFGVVRLGSQAAQGGAVSFLIILIIVNIFLGLVNLVPLLPFDGGHAAVATYEAIRGRIAGHPYRVNMARLMPITYAVVFLLGFIFLSSSYLDLVSPAQNPFTP